MSLKLLTRGIAYASLLKTGGETREMTIRGEVPGILQKAD